MKVEITPTQALQFVKQNWFTLTIFLLGFLFYLRKDLSFRINVATPENPVREKTSSSKGKMTDASPALAGNLGADRLEIPFIGDRQNGREASQELASIDEPTRMAFLERFVKVARAEQQKFGIPASVILAVSMYQSCAGKRDLTRRANNYFALPCTSGWQKGCNIFQDKSYRRYETAWASFRDFSLFAQENFSSLKGQDYKTWANGMQKSGFGEDGQFAKNVVQIIETYGLQKLDRRNW